MHSNWFRESDTYGSYINKGPREQHVGSTTLPYPGGFMFIRFDDAGYDMMNNALKMQQSICRHAGGYLIGIARKEKIYVYEIAQQNKQQNWSLARNQPHRQARATENAVAAFWFTKREAAESYFENGYRNRLREPCFPTPNGYEAYYVPLLSAPPMRPANTFLFIEFLMHPSKHAEYQERLTQFEAEMRDDMQRLVPECRPMVVSSQTGRVIFKPGLFVSPYSKLFISRFESQRDVDEILRIGMIEGLRRKWNLPSEMNVFSMTVEDAF
ncbi:hypothetical protein DPMN_170091 [Dreissena polymorpha]|uniref:Uncharacterized protein n=1 Tax=Dreissena polymorpha TaxID=45954 RepID=A0A9D4ICL1_DREPO|nr:hypothetical protein DPMN_170091 [Dreissena polymorpha]